MDDKHFVSQAVVEAFRGAHFGEAWIDSLGSPGGKAGMATAQARFWGETARSFAGLFEG